MSGKNRPKSGMRTAHQTDLKSLQEKAPAALQGIPTAGKGVGIPFSKQIAPDKEFNSLRLQLTDIQLTAPGAIDSWQFDSCRPRQAGAGQPTWQIHPGNGFEPLQRVAPTFATRSDGVYAKVRDRARMAREFSRSAD